MRQKLEARINGSSPQTDMVKREALMNALKEASYELSALHGLVVVDDPDLELPHSWEIDTTRANKIIEDALKAQN